MRRLKIGDRILRVRDEGEPPRTRISGSARRPPVVLVHGAGASSVLWMDTVRRLGPRRRVVAPDLPAHGQSDPWHALADVSIGMFADAVGTVCAQLGLARAVLVGHSMGGQIALECALRWPERVAGLVLVASTARLEVDPALIAAMEADLAAAQAPAVAAAGGVGTHGEVHRTLPRWARLLRPLLWSPATAPALVERWSGLLAQATTEAALADFRAVAAWDGRERVERLKVPTLILAGADDLQVSLSAVQDTARRIRGADLAVLPRAGHLPMLEQPAAWDSALDAFLSTIP